MPRELGLVAREEPVHALANEVAHAARLHRDHG